MVLKDNAWGILLKILSFIILGDSQTIKWISCIFFWALECDVCPGSAISNTAFSTYQCRVPLSSLGGGACEDYTLLDERFESQDNDMCEAEGTTNTYEMCMKYDGSEFNAQTCQDTYTNYMYIMAARGMTCDSYIGEGMMTIGDMFSSVGCCESAVSTSEPGSTLENNKIGLEELERIKKE